MEIPVETIYIIRTPDDVLKYSLANASVLWGINPLFMDGGYFYKVMGSIMYIFSEDLIDQDFNSVKMYVAFDESMKNIVASRGDGI